MKTLDIIKEMTSSPTTDARVERIKVEFVSSFDQYVRLGSDDMFQKTPVFDPKKSLSTLKSFVLSKIPQYAWGKYGDGSKWAKELSDFIIQNIIKETETIGWVQKQSIKLVAGNKDKFIQEASDLNYYRDYFQFLSNTCSDIGSNSNFKKEYENWVSDNLRNIISRIVTIAANKIYS